MKYFLCAILCLVLSASLSSCQKIQTSLDLINADMAYNQGNFPKAIELYKKILSEDPGKADFYWKIGVAYFSSGDKPNARRQVTALRKAGKEKLADDLERLIAQ